MEVDQWLDRNLLLNIALLLCLLELFDLSVVGRNVGVVVLRVVQLHDLAGNGWLEGAIVVYGCQCQPQCHVSLPLLVMGRHNIHGRSGSVAFPRMKVVLARAARLVVDGAADRRAERRALWRRSVLDIVVFYSRIRTESEVFQLCVVSLEDGRRLKSTSCGKRSFDNITSQSRFKLRAADMADAPSP